MAIEGADFIEVYRYFLEQTDQPDQSFESARRVFRGGLITGGAPFTKDVVYLTGLLSINYVIRACFAAGRADCLHLMFCGKLDLFATARPLRALRDGPVPGAALSPALDQRPAPSARDADLHGLRQPPGYRAAGRGGDQVARQRAGGADAQPPETGAACSGVRV
jgi:hypothetical protein